MSRRLLETELLNVVFTLRYITNYEISTFFPGYHVLPSKNKTQITIEAQTLDPAATIRSIQVIISQNDHWIVDVQPRIIYTSRQLYQQELDKMRNSTGTITGDDNIPIIAGAIGGTLFVICLIIGLCLLYRKKDNDRNSSPYSRIRGP